MAATPHAERAGVVIIGAGLAGLAVACALPNAALQARDAVVVDTRGAWLQDWEDGLTRAAVSHVRAPLSTLPAKPARALEAYAECKAKPEDLVCAHGEHEPFPSVDLVVDYATRKAGRALRNAGLALRGDTAVRVSAEAWGGARVTLASGAAIDADVVVYTPYVRRPVVPAWARAALKADGKRPWGAGCRVALAADVDVHTAPVARARVVVVGSGMTAACMALEAERRGAAEVWLVVPGPLECRPLEVEAKWVGRPGMLGAELAGCDPAARLHATRAALHLDTVDRTTHNALYNAFDGRTLRVVDEFKVASAEWDGTEWAVTRVPDDATVVAAFDHSSHRPWGAAAACFEAEPDIIACDVIWVVPEEEPHAPGDGVLVGAAEQAACGLAGGLAVLDPSPAPVWPGGKIPMYLVGRAASLATGPGVWLPAGLRVCAAAVADAVVARLSVARSVGSCPPRPAAASEDDDSSSMFAGVGSLLKLKQTAQHCGAGSPAQASASAYASSHPPHAGTEFRSAPACGGWGGSQVRAVGCSPYDLSPASPDRGPACAPIIYDYEPADPVVGMGLVQEVTTARANADFEARPSAMATDMPASPAYAEATPQVMHVSVAPHPSQAAAAALAWSPLALPQAPGPRCLDVCRDATTPSPVAAAASPMLHAPTPNGFFPQPGADAPPPPPPRADTARRPAGIVNISDLRPSFPVHQIIQFSWVDDGFFIRILLTLPEGVDKEQVRVAVAPMSADIVAVGPGAAYRLRLGRLYSRVLPNRTAVGAAPRQRKVTVTLHKERDTAWRFLHTASA